MLKRKFRISEDLKSYLRFVLIRKDVKYRFKKEGDQWYAFVNISGERFHRMVQRARCEKMTEETGVFHVTYEESQNQDVVFALLHDAGKKDGGGYVVMPQ